MGMLIAEILVLTLVGVSTFLVIWSLFRYPVPAEPPVHRRLAAALGVGRRQTLFENPLTAPVMALILTMAGRFGFAGIRDKVARDLDAAGNPQNYSVEEYLALCIGSAIVLMLVTSSLSLIFGGYFNPVVSAMMAFIGFAVPIYALHSAARARVTRISKQLPYTLDLIALMMEAGSTFTEAVATLVRDNPAEDFNHELQIVQLEIDFGTPRSQALANMASRIPLDSLRSIIGAVNQAEVLGTPLSTILKSQSGMMRMHRSVRAEKLSASASLRILIPTMLILMAACLTVFGPFIVRIARGEFSWFGT